MKKHLNHYKLGITGLMLIAILLVSSISFGSISQAQVTSFSIGQQVSPIVDLYLHSGNDVNSPNVTIMKKGTPATVTGAPMFEWYPLDYQGLSGWAAGKYLQPYSGTPAPTNAPATAPANQPAATPTQNQEESKPGQHTTPPPTTPGPNTTPTAGPIVPVTKKVDTHFTLPTEANSQGIMLGAFNGGNVRSAPTLTSTIITGWGYGRKVMIYQSVTGVSVNGNNVWYVVGKPPEREQVYYVHSSLVRIIGPIVVPQPQYRLTGHWIDVNLSQQSLTAFDGQTEVMHTLISSGAFTHTTDVGYWKIYYRLDKQEMKNPDPGQGPGVPGWYDLPNVPYPEYFNPAGEAIHGTYWHDNFGTPMSHGCVNATTPAAEWIYTQFANIGTPVIVHF